MIITISWLFYLLSLTLYLLMRESLSFLKLNISFSNSCCFSLNSWIVFLASFGIESRADGGEFVCFIINSSMSFLNLPWNISFDICYLEYCEKITMTLYIILYCLWPKRSRRSLSENDFVWLHDKYFVKVESKTQWSSGLWVLSLPFYSLVQIFLRALHSD